MTAEELISRLKTMVEDHGDAPVVMENALDIPAEVTDVNLEFDSTSHWFLLIDYKGN